MENLFGGGSGDNGTPSSVSGQLPPFALTPSGGMGAPNIYTPSSSPYKFAGLQAFPGLTPPAPPAPGGIPLFTPPPPGGKKQPTPLDIQALLAKNARLLPELGGDAFRGIIEAAAPTV